MSERLSEELMERIQRGEFVECRYLHPNSCLWEAFEKFYKSLLTSLKYYSPIHLIPLFVFKLKQLRKKPLKVILRTLMGIIKSCLFMSLYVAIFRYGLCFFKNLRHKIDKWNVILAGFVCSFSLIFEPVHRRAEIALYTLPRFIDGFWNLLKKNQLVGNVKYGEVMIFAFAMGVIMYCYQNEESNIRPSYMNMFKKFWGKN